MNSFPHAIFRAYDIRGKVNLLTPEVVRAIAHALSCLYKKTNHHTVVIGYDARMTSPMYAAIIEDVCQSAGLQTQMIGCCSSPMLYFMARSHGGNGIMVTASHNPKTDNGIKWLVNGEPPTPEMIQLIAEEAENSLTAHHHGAHHEIRHQRVDCFCEQYQQALAQDIHLKQTFKVVLDGMHGSAGHCAAEVFKALGCEVIDLRCDANGDFPDHAPDPSQHKHLKLLKDHIKQHQADIGVALDGDGDRLVVVDENGTVITADQLLSLFAEMTLKAHPQHEIVLDVKCSKAVLDVIEQAQGQSTMIRTGSSFLRRYLAQSNGRAVFGGEYAGHYVFNDGRGFGYDDGLYAALRILEYLDELQTTVSGLMRRYPARCSTEDLYISTHDFNALDVLAHIKQQSLNLIAKMTEIDGIRLDFQDGFGIIRASNTGEYLTLRFDADTSVRLNQIQQIFISMLAPYPNIARDLAQA